jgi:hypothetical protein
VEAGGLIVDGDVCAVRREEELETQKGQLKMNLGRSEIAFLFRDRYRRI